MLELQCRYSDRVTCFYWFKDGIKISGCSSYKYKKVADGGSGGSYQCGVRLDYWKKSAPVDVVIIASNMTLSLEVRQKASLSGERIAMHCLVPAGTFTGPKVFLWYRNEELIARNDQSQYTIRRAKRSDEASYRCELQINYRKWTSPEVNVTVTVPVAGAVLTSNSNNSEISAGGLLVLHCQVKAGTQPHFHWYLNNQQLQNTNESYQINTDGSVLIIESFQRSHGGRYHCVATNQGTTDLEFNTTSNFIDVTLQVQVQSSTTSITAWVLPPFLVASLIVLILCKRRNKRKDNSSSFSQPQGKSIGNETQPLSEESSPINFMHTVAGSATNTDNAAGVSGGKRRNKSGSSDNSVAYSIYDDAMTEAGLEGRKLEEGDSSDVDIYANLP
ncbi:Fc receptor-like protein 1 isoform X2 [Heterodontus francisci]